MPSRNTITVEELIGQMTDDDRKKYLSDQKRAIEKATQIIPSQNSYILVLDFDGVLHSYTSGWQGVEVIPDPPVLGAQDFCASAMRMFEVWIVSSRCSKPGGSEAIERWLSEYSFPEGLHVSKDGSKPAAFVTLDDRAITFNGLWPDPEALRNFEPWYRRRLNPQDTIQEVKGATHGDRITQGRI